MAQIIALLLFFLPLVVFPIGITPFEIPKVILAEILIGLLLVFSIYAHPQLLSNVNKTQFKLILLTFFLTLVHLIFYQTSTTFFGNMFRLQGVFLLWNLLVFSVVSSQVDVSKLNKWIPFVSLVVLFVSSFMFGANEANRAVGTLGEPNALAATAVFFWPFIYFGKRRDVIPVIRQLAEHPESVSDPGRTAFTRMTDLVIYVSLVMTVIIIFLSGSRSGVVVFGLQILVLILDRLTKLHLKQITAISLTILSLSLIFQFFNSQEVFENRSEVWRTAVYAGLKNPVLGGGFGNTEHLLKQTAMELNNNLQYQYVDSAHNIFLDWWVQAGASGVIILGTIIYLFFKNLILHKKILEIVLLLGILTMMSFNPVSVVTLIAFWWLVGQGFKKDQDKQSNLYYYV